MWRFRLASAATLNFYSQHAIPVLKEWALLADGQARQRTVDIAKAAARKWWQWVDDQMRNGGGALHSYCKRDERVRCAPAPLLVPGGFTLGIQALLDNDREAWRKVWERFAGAATAPWREHCLYPWAADLPRISGTEVARAAKRFKKNTGLGCDAFRPQWLSWLSDELLDHYARLLMVIESMGCWPQMISVLLIAQIPKPDGGRRPIGLLPTMVRVWEKLRKPVMESWRTTVVRSYNFAAKGKSSETAAWLQAHKAELTASKGGFSAAVLYDLVKAFEMVRLELVWAAGLRMHCPPTILRLELEAFAFVRRLMCQGVVAEPICTLSGI